MKDYYYILGIRPDASRSEIRSAYRKLSLKFHPDKNKGDPFFEKHFKEILEAFEVLYNEDEKRNYDQRYKSKNTYYSYSGEIISFQANKTTVLSGEEITFFWATKNVKYIYLSCHPDPLPPSGQKTLKIHTQDEKDLAVVLSATDNRGIMQTRTLLLHLKKPAEPGPSEEPKVVKKEKTGFVNRDIGFIAASVLTFAFLAFSIRTSSVPWHSSPSSSPSPPVTESARMSVSPMPMSGDETLLKFISLLDDQNYVEAYSLTANAFWKNFPFFRDSVWGDLQSYEIIQSPEIRHYTSKWGADRIYNLQFSAIDVKKNSIRQMDYDFHMAKVNEEWSIIRMAYPRDSDPWYEDDHLYKTKDDPLLAIFNRPHVLLQRYYDNFFHRDSVRNNLRYYNDLLVIHFDDTMISAEKAVYKDLADFETNNIESYVILVNSYSMVTEFFEQFDLVKTPLVYYITHRDGKRTKYDTSITAVLNKENDRILALDKNITMEDLAHAIESHR